MFVFRYAVSNPLKGDARQQFHADHKAHIRNAPFRIVSSGPAFLPGSEATAAALLIAEVTDIEELKAFSALDPFVIHDVYSSVSILEWRPTIGPAGNDFR